MRAALAAARLEPLARRLDEPSAARHGVARQRGHAHRHQGSLLGGQRAHHGQELLGARAIDEADERAALRRDLDHPLPPIGDLFVALEEAARLQRRDDARRGGGRSADHVGQVGDGQRGGPGRCVERGQLGEAKAQLAELGREADDQISPQRLAHGDAIGELQRVLDDRAGGRDLGRDPRSFGSGPRPAAVLRSVIRGG